MKPIGIVGVVLVVVGLVILAMQGISYTRSREVVQVGPLEVAAEERGMIPPIAGVGALVVGVALVLMGRSRPS